MDHIRIVLVGTSHPGNIGAAARAMKNMGIHDLRLVNPKTFPHKEATVRASSADDILASAQVYTDLADAVADCELVYATSARTRTLNWVPVSAQEAGEQIISQPQKKMAILFGNERSGLSNDELNIAHHRIYIPTSESYSSLNLAQAVQVICYELFRQWHNQSPAKKTAPQDESPLASMEQMESYMTRLEQLLLDIEFLKPPHSMLLKRIRRLYNRAHCDQNELNILQGILSATNRAISKDNH
jgi:tRNA/rRNA methyltransferase/tRNA (cytidine32/uridine32-2'-O)-methyltransferase